MVSFVRIKIDRCYHCVRVCELVNNQLGWIVGYTDAYNGMHTCHFQAESINQQTSLPLPALIIY